MSFDVVATYPFERKLKKLAKKHRSLKADLVLRPKLTPGAFRAAIVFSFLILFSLSVHAQNSSTSYLTDVVERSTSIIEAKVYDWQVLYSGDRIYKRFEAIVIHTYYSKHKLVKGDSISIVRWGGNIGDDEQAVHGEAAVDLKEAIFFLNRNATVTTDDAKYQFTEPIAPCLYQDVLNRETGGDYPWGSSKFGNFSSINDFINAVDNNTNLKLKKRN